MGLAKCSGTEIQEELRDDCDQAVAFDKPNRKYIPETGTPE